MTKIGLLRCPQNDTKCPLTSCLKTMAAGTEGFSGYEGTELAGVFTLTDSRDKNMELAKILKAKGADVLHLVTCGFAKKQDGKWYAGNGFVEGPEELMSDLAKETGLPCVLGGAHLPEGYTPVIFGPGTGEPAEHI